MTRVRKATMRTSPSVLTFVTSIFLLVHYETHLHLSPHWCSVFRAREKQGKGLHHFNTVWPKVGEKVREVKYRLSMVSFFCFPSPLTQKECYWSCCGCLKTKSFPVKPTAEITRCKPKNIDSLYFDLVKKSNQIATMTISSFNAQKPARPKMTKELLPALQS